MVDLFEPHFGDVQNRKVGERIKPRYNAFQDMIAITRNDNRRCLYHSKDRRGVVPILTGYLHVVYIPGNDRTAACFDAKHRKGVSSGAKHETVCKTVAWIAGTLKPGYLIWLSAIQVHGN